MSIHVEKRLNVITVVLNGLHRKLKKELGLKNTEKIKFIVK